MQDDSVFQTVDDESVAQSIDDARERVVYLAPAVGTCVAKALVRAISRSQDGTLAVTVVLDADEDAYRIGYGDPAAFRELIVAANGSGFELRRQQGLRIGLLACDDRILVWAPTPRSIESERAPGQPNGIVLSQNTGVDVTKAVDGSPENQRSEQAEIGQQSLTPQEAEETIQALTTNPPAPFDLSLKTRVFSTRYQFVEFEVQGAEWTQRRIKLSSLLLNADLPEVLQDVVETQIRPFQAETNRAFPVPHFVNGRPAYEQDGSRMKVPATQADVRRVWAEIRDNYLYHLKGFGWLIRRDRLQEFRSDVKAYEETLRAWVSAFRKHAQVNEDRLVEDITSSVEGRLQRSSRPEKLKGLNLKREVRRGLDRLRVIEPRVRLVLKNVSWESSRDQDFTTALQRALPPEDLADWFEEFTAAREGEGSTS